MSVAQCLKLSKMKEMKPVASHNKSNTFISASLTSSNSSGDNSPSLLTNLSLHMIKQLTTVGNSKAVILPAALVKKYKLDRVVIEETDEGILIRPVGEQNRF